MPKILVVEDEADIADFIRRGLVRSGFEVEVTHTGRQALEAALSRSPDLMILDLMLPDMDGIEVCSQLRAGGKDMGIVILTARHLVGERVQAIRF
jgi:DNA-binding response OmpR family regulator